MCGRYRFDGGTIRPADIEAGLGMPLDGASPPALEMLSADTVMRPYNEVPVIFRRESGELALELMYWQLIHPWCEAFESKYTNFNTRFESLDKPHNRELLECRRCLFPATSFFESRRLEDGTLVKPRESYEFLPEGGGVMFLGGIYNLWYDRADPEAPPRPSCSMITMQPNRIVGEVHPRMPFVVPPQHRRHWVELGTREFEFLTALIKPVSSERLLRFRET